MKWIDWLERQLDFLVIPQFPLFIACANACIFLLAQFRPIFVERLFLDPSAVLAGGEWWRVITFLFVPPMSMNPIFLALWLLFLYQMAQALENAWGEFRFLLFYLIGAVATVVAALVILHEPMGNTYLNTTIILAFATLFPDFEFYIFPLPWPIKMKYFGWLMWFITVVSFILGSFSVKMAIGASLANYALFFGGDIWTSLRLRWDVYRNRRRFR